MKCLIRLLPLPRLLWLVLALPALAGCQKTLVFFEQTAVKLGISVNEEPPVPLEVTVGLKRRVVAISPPRKPLQGGRPVSEAVSLLSRFDVIYVEDERPLAGKLRIVSAFASGAAAVTIARNPISMAAIVGRENVRDIVTFTADQAPPLPPPLPLEQRVRNAISPAEQALTFEEGKQVQAALCLRGPDIDGDFGREGSKTREAIKQWQAAATPTVSGELMPGQGTLLADLGRRVPCPQEFKNAYERFNLGLAENDYSSFDPEAIEDLQGRLSESTGITMAPAQSMNAAIRSAIEQVQRENGWPVTGELTLEVDEAID